MRLLLCIVSGFFFFFIFPLQTHAIVFLPALILIPIAKIIAVIIGGFALPAVGMSVIYTKLFGTPLKKVLMITLFLLIILTISIGVYLKIENPLRPLF